MKNRSIIFLTVVFASLAGLTTNSDAYWRDNDGDRHYTRIGAATSNFIGDVFDPYYYDGRYHHHIHHHVHHVRD